MVDTPEYIKIKNKIMAEPNKLVREKKMMKIFISEKLIKILGKLMQVGDYQVKTVANRIIGLSKSGDLFERSYFDIVKGKHDLVSFMPAARAWRSMEFKDQEEADKQPAPTCPMWEGAGRQEVGIGKMINYLFDDFTDMAVNKFVNAYKAEIDSIYIYNNFKIVKGEEIRYWYDGKNYVHDDGVLNGSCMRYGKDEGGRNCQPFFDLYVENTNCGMLVLIDGNNKLLGRALVWFGLRKPTDKTFMDRIYTVKQSDEEMFKKYAVEQGWIFKYSQSAHDASYMEDGKRIQKSIAIRLNPKEYKKYPYMDTLKYYNAKTGRLASDAGNPVDGTKRIKLESGDGSYQNVD